MSLTLMKSKGVNKIGCHVIKYGPKSELDIKEVTACYVRDDFNKIKSKKSDLITEHIFKYKICIVSLRISPVNILRKFLVFPKIWLVKS